MLLCFCKKLQVSEFIGWASFMILVGHVCFCLSCMHVLCGPWPMYCVIVTRFSFFWITHKHHVQCKYFLVILRQFTWHVCNFHSPKKKPFIVLPSAHVYIHHKVIFIILFMIPTCSGVIEITMFLITRHLFRNSVNSENIKGVSDG